MSGRQWSREAIRHVGGVLSLLASRKFAWPMRVVKVEVLRNTDPALFGETAATKVSGDVRGPGQGVVR